jgi:hypothetical protein
MPNVVKLLRSTTSGAAPSALVSGQIAINEADGKIFWLDANGVTIRSVTLKDLDTIISGKLAKTSNLSDLVNPATARSNLGLGSAAGLNAGILANNVVQLDASARLPAVNGSQLSNVSATNASNLGGVAASSYALKSDVPMLLETLTGSGVGALAKSDCFTADYKFYDVVFENIRGSVNGAALYMQLYVGAYQATGYSAYTAIWNPGGAAGYHYSTLIDLMGGGRLVNNATWGGLCGLLSFINPVQSAYAPNLFGRTSFADATYGPYAAWTHISAMRTSLGAVTGFQVYPSSGTITGTIKIYGRP